MHTHDYEFRNYCGASVCIDCDDHKGLARCFCGWSLSDGNGYNELLEAGETIEPDYGYGGYADSFLDDGIYESYHEMYGEDADY